MSKILKDILKGLAVCLIINAVFVAIVTYLRTCPSTCEMGLMKSCPHNTGIQFGQYDHWTACYDMKMHPAHTVHEGEEERAKNP